MDNVLINIFETPEQVTVSVTDNSDSVTINVSELGSQGAQGAKGNIEFVTLGGSVSSGNVVYINNGLGYRFDASNVSLQNRMFGIAKQSGNASDIIEVFVSGVAEVSGWGLSQNLVYWATNTGGLTITPSDNLYEMIGTAISSDKLLINKLSIKII